MGKLKVLRTTSAERKRKKPRKIKFSQDILPLKKYDADFNVFKTDENTFVRAFHLDNINYKILSRDHRMDRLEKWFNLLNTLEPGIPYKYTIIKRLVDENEFKEKRYLPMQNDKWNEYRKEYNHWQKQNNKKGAKITEDCYLQINVSSKTAEEADREITRYQQNLFSEIKLMGSNISSVDSTDYLEAIYNFLHLDDISFFKELNIERFLKARHGVDDLLAPAKLTYLPKDDCLFANGTYYRTLYIPPSGFANYIKDDIIFALTERDRNFSLSVDILPVPTDQAVKLVEQNAMKVETNITNWQERQNRHNNFSAQIPYNLRKQRETQEEWNKDLHEADQRLFLSFITMVIAEDSIEKLNEETKEIKSIARANGCKMESLTLEQEDGLMTALPLGVNRFLTEQGEKLRTLTTQGLAAFIPFTVQERTDENGIFYGRNAISGRGIYIDRKSLMNGNASQFGSSGSGKSFKKKEEEIYNILNSKDKLIIFDPEREYTNLIEQLGGTVIKLSPTSLTHINAMDIAKGKGEDQNPVIMKTEFMLSLYAAISKQDSISPQEMTVIDEATRMTYADYIANEYSGTLPTLSDFVQSLKMQNDPLSENIAKAFGIFTTGSLNTFAFQTNVDMSNRLICFDTNQLGDHLQPIGMLIIMDYITNTLIRNRDEKIATWVDVDEIYLLWQLKTTGNFMWKLSKRIRKYGGLLTAITQQVADSLATEAGKAMMANSEFCIITSLNDEDAPLVAEVLNLTEEQMKYVRNVGPGKGIIKLGSTIIPFEDEFPQDTSLYRLMSTKFHED